MGWINQAQPLRMRKRDRGRVRDSLCEQPWVSPWCWDAKILLISTKKIPQLRTKIITKCSLALMVYWLGISGPFILRPLPNELPGRTKGLWEGEWHHIRGQKSNRGVAGCWPPSPLNAQMCWIPLWFCRLSARRNVYKDTHLHLCHKVRPTHTHMHVKHPISTHTHTKCL